MKMKRGWVMLAVLLSCCAMPARAVDGVSLQLGRGDETDMAQLTLFWDWNKRLYEGTDWHIGGTWEVSLGYWRSQDALPGQNEDLFEIGVTPVLRLQRNRLTGPYLELGIGPHLLSEAWLGHRSFGVVFEFGSVAGFGYRFGAERGFEIGYRFEHLSNADIDNPASGIEFHQVRLLVRF